jgi:hypothetical protein
LHPDSDSVEIPLPGLSSQDEIGCFALTVLFDDNGDGGPVVEWTPKGGSRTLLSAGLGDTGVALGINARTLLLPESMTLDGGTINVSFAGRFARLRSVTLRPARNLAVASLFTGDTPALITPEGSALSDKAVSGESPVPQTGDLTEGRVVSAELSAAPVRLDTPDGGNATEFVVPVTELPAGAVLAAEIGGLDPSSWIEISVNGVVRGALAPSRIPLTAPEAILTPDGRLLLAGWHSGSLFLPASLWKSGENSITFRLHRDQGDPGNALYLRGIRCDLLFPATEVAKPSTEPASSPNPDSAADQLSTGSLFGNPSPNLFRSTLPAPANP